MSFGDELDRGREEIERRVREASEGWASAMRAHVLAPPDAGFAARLQVLADAAIEEQLTWEQAHAAGLTWRPIPGAEGTPPPYELRPGTGRRGPAPLWERFDRRVAALNRAISGSSAVAVADAFGDLADVSGQLAAAIASKDGSAPASGAPAPPTRLADRGAA